MSLWNPWLCINVVFICNQVMVIEYTKEARVKALLSHSKECSQDTILHHFGKLSRGKRDLTKSHPVVLTADCTETNLHFHYLKGMQNVSGTHCLLYMLTGFYTVWSCI